MFIFSVFSLPNGVLNFSAAKSCFTGFNLPFILLQTKLKQQKRLCRDRKTKVIDYEILLIVLLVSYLLAHGTRLTFLRSGNNATQIFPNDETPPNRTKNTLYTSYFPSGPWRKYPRRRWNHSRSLYIYVQKPSVERGGGGRSNDSYSHHRVHTKWQWPLSVVHSIMNQ